VSAYYDFNIYLCRQKRKPINIPELKEKSIESPLTFAELWQKSRLKVTDGFTAPPVILRVGDSIVGTLGNFSASTGKAKSKKTFNVCTIIASALTNGTVLRYSASFPDEKRQILYADTEQSKFHRQKVLRRILQLADLPTDITARHIGIFVFAQIQPENSARHHRGSDLSDRRFGNH
jgi:hypothetical protein